MQKMNPIIILQRMENSCPAAAAQGFFMKSHNGIDLNTSILSNRIR